MFHDGLLSRKLLQFTARFKFITSQLLDLKREMNTILYTGTCIYTVEPSKKDTFASGTFVLYLGSVLWVASVLIEVVSSGGRVRYRRFSTIYNEHACTRTSMMNCFSEFVMQS